MSRIMRFIKRRLLIVELKKRNVVIGDKVGLVNADLKAHVNVAHHAEVADSVIDCYTSIGRYTKVKLSDIGKFCSISWNVTIGALEHPLNAVSMHAFSFRKSFGLCDEDRSLPQKRVTIGNDVWIGCGAIIKSGVTIGDGAVIGAGACVLHDVEPYEIVGGIPAKHIRYRFPEHIRSRLIKLQWWNYSEAKLKSNIDLFSPDIDLNSNCNVLDRLENA